jgi:hypothetical protein
MLQQEEVQAFLPDTQGSAHKPGVQGLPLSLHKMLQKV